MENLSTSTHLVIDQLGREVCVPKTPKRIISLVPSQTELLHDLGLENEVIGITKFCIHPKSWYSTKTRIGGTKNIDLEKIKLLNPDLIIGNKEENTKEAIETLALDFPVWMSDVNTFNDAILMIEQLGALTNRNTETESIKKSILAVQNSLSRDSKPKRTCIYLMWNNPLMCAGKNTFINEMLSEAGLTNLISEDRYPEITLERIQELQPELLLLSTEPYPFDNKYLSYFKKKVKNTKVMIVDGEMFSWYGSRLLKSFSYFNELFHQ